jgi:hypothetical protein
MKTILTMLVALCVIVAFAVVTQPATVDAAKSCKRKTHKTDYIKNACKKSYKTARKAMVKVRKAGKFDGCDSCHGDKKEIVKRGALKKLCKTLKKMGIKDSGCK